MEVENFEEFSEEEKKMLEGINRTDKKSGKAKKFFAGLTAGLAMFIAAKAKAIEPEKNLNTVEVSQKEQADEKIEEKKEIARDFLEYLHQTETDKSQGVSNLVKNMREDYKEFCARLYKLDNPTSDSISVGFKEQKEGAELLNVVLPEFAKEMEYGSAKKLIENNPNFGYFIKFILSNSMQIPDEYAK